MKWVASPWAGKCEADEKPVHTVCVDGFYIGKYEVTQGQWKIIMGNNPSNFSNCGNNCPVEEVSWYDIQKFIKRLDILHITSKVLYTLFGKTPIK